MRKNEREFRSIDLAVDSRLQALVARLPQGYGVVMLNQFAVDITINWICNVDHMKVNCILKSQLFCLLKCVFQKVSNSKSKFM